MSTDISTVKKLREYLDDLESKWSEEDQEYLGNFEDTPIMAWPNSGGYGPARITSDVDGTLVVYFAVYTSGQ